MDLASFGKLKRDIERVKERVSERERERRERGRECRVITYVYFLFFFSFFFNRSAQTACAVLQRAGYNATWLDARQVLIVGMIKSENRAR